MASDIERPYHAGDTISLHWIVTPARNPGYGSHGQIELTSKVIGPYADVASLKSAVSNGSTAATFTINATPVHPSDEVGERPVSTIMLPSTAAGFYNLEWSVTEAGNAASAASVIQVLATS